MIKIDDKTRERIFALYWGCDVILTGYGDDQHVTVGRLSEMDIYDVGVDHGLGVKREGYDHASIIVTPLRDITDEHAISVARITQKPYTGIEISKRGFKVIGTPVGKSDDVKYVLVESFIHHPNVMEWVPTALVQIDHDDGDVIVGEWDGFAQEFTDGFTDHYMEVTDYLRAHGYATPCCGFTIDQLVEAGIFKIKTQEHERV